MTTSWSRRGFLHAAGGTTLAHALATAASAADRFSALRDRWCELVLGTGFSPTTEPFRSELAAIGQEAGRFRQRITPSAGSLWPDLVFADPHPSTGPESFGYSQNMNNSYVRLRTMALAYAQPGTGLTGDAGLRADLLSGLDQLYQQVYNENQQRFGNWWNWQIGAPQALLDSCVLLHGELSGTQIGDYCRAVDHYVPDSAVAEYSGTSTGANRVDLCRVLALRGIVGGRAAKVALARDALSPVFPYVAEGDGLYADGSFIQHTTVPYTGTYGSVLLGGLGMLFSLLAGSDWEVTDPNRQIVFDAVEGAWAPFLYNGLVMDGVSGRAISRGLSAGDPRQVQQDDHVRGHAIIASIALLAGAASSAERERWRGLIKGWIRRDRCRPVLADRTLGVHQLTLLKEIDDDSTVRPVAEPTGHRLFAAMDRATHRRPGWAASISMASRRIAHYEVGNGENLRGWHTGNGMLYWWGDTFGNDQYSDAFWPTVDPYRLPGITVSRKTLADGEGGAWGTALPDVSWVGGTTDGRHAALGQHVRGVSSTLMAKKSWFCLDDAIVCLGAGITCQDGTAVESIVENRNLGATGSPPLVVDGAAQPVSLPWSGTLSNAGWAHIGGFGGTVGYVFPGGATVEALREQRTGSWRAVNRGGTTTAISRRYLTLWFDHGTDPSHARYAYLVLPGANRAQTSARAADTGWLRILSNTGDQQGAQVPSLGFTTVNFWSGGAVGGITASAPCSVLIRENADGTAVICVSDPIRARSGLTVSWDRAIGAVLARPPTVTGATTGSSLTLAFGGLSGAMGATQRITVQLG
ncbi:polysaccharide lyase 8 family protein [Streptomyces gobiensis]|uniref:polysaccharide lyase 8 family protein n=1 Tax=Streptomyces gobiensis TaxID=2875706 RepID=UPI001E29B23E|nr:polysaccharide lyase 8 family protein [Streptomyces gobiensis]UGY94307.1 polysaccharide lyase 8 family protein [Streptomyces gobiensis]